MHGITLDFYLYNLANYIFLNLSAHGYGRTNINSFHELIYYKTLPNTRL